LESFGTVIWVTWEVLVHDIRAVARNFHGGDSRF
jgi:hypothetical protein